jgi:hypothetical protein
MSSKFLYPDAVIPAACGFRVCSDARDVDKGYFEAALERPEFVITPPTCNVNLPSAIEKSTKVRLLLLPNLNRDAECLCIRTREPR